VHKETGTVFKALANIGTLMRQAQQMGEKMQAVNERLKHERATGSAGGDMVVVEVNGLSEVVRVTIDPTLVTRGETEMIEDLTAAAVNQALQKAKELHVAAMQSLTEGMDVPGLEDALSQITGKGT
jgi:DNA-binding YbaB/EbfC family protein